MVRVGGFLKTQNRVRRQRARGRFISPYQVGGTIFGKSTMARYPLMNTTHRINPEPWRVKQALRRMKGGTIFSKSTRRQNNPFGFPIGIVPDQPRTLEGEAGPAPYERGHDLWPGGSQKSVVGQSGQSQEATTGYKKETPLNHMNSSQHVAPTL